MLVHVNKSKLDNIEIFFEGAQREGSQTRQTRDRGTQQQSQETSTMTSNTATGPKTVTASVGTQNNVGSQVSTLKFTIV